MIRTEETISRRARYETGKLFKRLRRKVGQAIEDYCMISPGDRIMVCLSGGKDSYALLDALLALHKKAPVPFELTAVNLDQKQPGFPAEVLPTYLRSRNVPLEVIEQDTYSVVRRVVPEGKTFCSLCSRLRRGALYHHAETRGYNKVALGHHLDDIVATFFLNLFHGGRLKAMPPKLRSDNGRHIVIRPLAYCREAELAAYARQRDFPIIPCTLCGSQESLQRVKIRRLMNEWEHHYPGRTEQIFRALTKVDASQLADTTLFDFAGLDAASPARWLMREDGR